MNTLLKTFLFAFVGVAFLASTVQAEDMTAQEKRVARFHQRVADRTEDTSESMTPTGTEPLAKSQVESYSFSERIDLRTEDASDKLPMPDGESAAPNARGIPEGCFDSDNAEKRKHCINKWSKRVESRTEE